MLDRLRRALGIANDVLDALPEDGGPGQKSEHKTLGSFIALHGLPSAPWGKPPFAKLAQEGYAANPIAFRCVRLVSEAAASVPLEARRAGRVLEADDPAAAVLRAPNPDQSLTELLETFYGQLQVGGNAFLEAVDLDGEVRELYALRPDRLSVAADERGHLTGWAYARTPSEKPKHYPRDPVTGRSRILHLKIFHPGDDHYGLAPLEAAAFSVDTHNAAGRWNKALLDNAARPSGALVYTNREAGDRLTPEQFERLKAELADAHTGAGQAGRPLLLEGGLEWRPFGLSPADMDFVEAKNIAAREIALAFGAPPMLLGIPGDNTYANYKEANLAFWRQTVLPLARKTARAMERWLRPWFGADLDIHTREDDVPALAEERGAHWRRLSDATFLSVEERRRLAGLPADALS